MRLESQRPKNGKLPTDGGGTFMTGVPDSQKLPPISNPKTPAQKAAPVEALPKQTPMEYAKSLSARRVAATISQFQEALARQEEHERHAYHRMERIETDAEVLRLQEAKLAADVRSARATLMSVGGPTQSPRAGKSAKIAGPPVEESPVAIQEAMRETARDCVRREQIARLEAAAEKARENAERIAFETEALRVEQEHKLEGKRQQEEAFIESKRKALELKSAAQQSFAEENAATKAAIAKLQQQRADKLANVIKSRREAKDKRAQEDKDAAEKREKEQALFFERRRRLKAEAKAQADADTAAESARRLELVAKEAHAVVARCQADYDRVDLKATVLAQKESQDTDLIAALEAEKAKMMERLVGAQELEKAARAKWEAAAQWGKPKAEA